MFSNLRVGSPFHILTKGDNPTLRIGSVSNIGQQKPKYNTTAMHNVMEMVIDVSVKVGEDTMNFEQLPCNLSIVDFGQSGMVVSESKEAMTAEVESMMRASKQIIESIDYHERVISSCEEMLKTLNPQFAKEKERDEEMNTLKAEVGEIRSSLVNMEGMLTKMLNFNTKKQ